MPVCIRAKPVKSTGQKENNLISKVTSFSRKQSMNTARPAGQSSDLGDCAESAESLLLTLSSQGKGGAEMKKQRLPPEPTPKHRDRESRHLATSTHQKGTGSASVYTDATRH